MSYKKVTIFSQDLAGGGAERVLVNIANGLAEMGVPVDLLLVRPVGPFVNYVSRRVKVIPLETKRVLNSIGALRRYIVANQPYSLLSALPHANVAAVIAARASGIGTKVVISEHSVPSFAMQRSSRRMIRWSYRVAPLVYPWADVVVAVSDGVAADLSSTLRVPPEKITRIYNPIATELPEAGVAASPPHPWLAEDQPPVIMAMGRLAPVKDFSTLLRGFAILRRTLHARLIILGEGPLRYELMELADTLGIKADLALPGFVDNPLSWLRHAAVFAATSISESFGNAIVEALLCGTPVVATDCPFGPREILNGGQFGTLVPVGNPELLAAGLYQMIRCPPCSDLLKKHAQRFGVARAVNEYARLLLGEE